MLQEYFPENPYLVDREWAFGVWFHYDNDAANAYYQKMVGKRKAQPEKKTILPQIDPAIMKLLLQHDLPSKSSHSNDVSYRVE